MAVGRRDSGLYGGGQGVAGGRGDRGLYDGRNVSGAMWLEVGKTEDCMMDAMYQGARMRTMEVGERQRTVWWTQCIRSQDVAGGRRDRGQYGGGNV